MSINQCKIKILQNFQSDKLYCIDSTGMFTYQDLSRTASKFAQTMIENDVKKVLIDLPQCFYSYALILASYLCGIEFCVINRQWSDVQKKIVVESYMPDLVISDVALCEFYKNYNKTLTDYQIVNREEKKGFSWESCLRQGRCIYTLFTSGTTGVPKGVRIKSSAVSDLIIWATKKFNIKENDIWGQYANIYFDMSMFDIFGSAYVGCVLVAFGEFVDKLRPGIKIRQCGVTFINAVPQLLEILIRAKQFNTYYLSTLRMMKFGGDKVYTSQMENLYKILPNLDIVLTYGPTETTIFTTYVKFNIKEYKKYSLDILCLGKPVKGSGLFLDNKGDEVSEIIISGSKLALGYTNSDQKGFDRISIGNKSVKVYRTGDYAKEIQGQLYFRGRKDNQIKIRGIRTTLFELESLLLNIGLTQFEVIVVNNKLYLFYAEINLSVSEIMKRISILPQYLIPSQIIKLDKLPLNDNSKVDRTYLRSMIEKHYE